MATFNGAEIAALDADVQLVGAFVRLATDPVTPLWLGASHVKVGVNALDPSGQTYLGCGMLPNVPAFKALINGRAERIDLALSGVSDRLFALATGEIDAVRGKACDIGFGLFRAVGTADDDDTYGPMLGPVRWLRHGVVDKVTLARVPGSREQQPVQRVVISAGSFGTGIRRRAYAYWTDQDQQGRSPGDRFCERTTKMSLLGQKIWPRY